MDEKQLSLKKGQALPFTDDVYRIVLSTDRDRKNKNIPALRCFSLAPSDNGCLSVDWAAMTTPEESIARFGATYKLNKEEFKPYENREVYSLHVEFVSSINEVDAVIYDPIIHTHSATGKVDNRSHSLIRFIRSFTTENPNDPEVIIKLRDHAASRRVDVNFDHVHHLVKELRK